VHFRKLHISSITPTKRTLFSITYLYHVSPACFGVSHTIFRENVLVPYSTTPALTQLLTMVQWLRHKT